MSRGGCCKVGEERAPIEPREFVDDLRQSPSGTQLLLSGTRTKLVGPHRPGETVDSRAGIGTLNQIDPVLQRSMLQAQPSQEPPERTRSKATLAGKALSLDRPAAIPLARVFVDDRSIAGLGVLEIVAAQIKQRLSCVPAMGENEKRGNP